MEQSLKSPLPAWLSLMLWGSFLAHSAVAGIVPGSVSAQPGEKALTASRVVHLVGLGDVKSKEEGTLNLTAGALTFAGRTSTASIDVKAMTAVSSDTQRVELWGTKGRLLRMVMPQGSGLAAAAVMHHKIHMLSVEYRDALGAYHGAVFLASGDDADRIVQALARTSNEYQTSPAAPCGDARMRSGSVLVSLPTWNDTSVPQSYRALAYEHLIERLRHVKGIQHVYRDGEANAASGCAQYSVQLSFVGFKAGSQVVRASTGPLGMFVGTTQMKFDLLITEAKGKLNFEKQITATQRADGEDANVTDVVAKKVAKQIAVARGKMPQ